MVFRKSKQKICTPLGKDAQVALISGGFYSHEKAESPENSLYCLYPLDAGGDVEFATLAKEYAASLLNRFPAVINQCQSIFSEDIREEAFFHAYLKTGKKPIFTKGRTVITMTEGIDDQLLDCIPKNESAHYELTFYGFLSPLSAKFKKSDYAIKVYYHEEHDYLQLEVPHIADFILEQLLEICKKHQRKLNLLQ